MVVKKKTKKRKQLRRVKRQRQGLEHLAAEEALQLIEEMLVQGNPREALQALQQVPFSAAPEFQLLKAEAYGWRARQLAQKQLNKESAAVLELLEKLLAGMPTVPCDRLARVLAAAPAEFGIRYYRQHHKQHPDCSSLEQTVANLLVTSNQWDLLENLPAESVVYRDGPLMAKAAEELVKAHWREALTLLEPLPRKSPFAPWKLFAKAMLSAVSGQEEDLQKALRQVPPDFPLHRTVDILRQHGCAGLGKLRERLSAPSRTTTQAFIAAIRSGSRRLPDLIEQWTRERFPQYGDVAVRSVAELAAVQLVRQEYDLEEIEDFLPRPFALPISLRLEMFLRSNSDAQPFCMALNYLDAADYEFAGVATRESLVAAVYFVLLSRSLLARRTPRDLRELERSCLQHWLADVPVAERDLFVAAIAKIIRLAPDTAAYHQILKEFDLRDLSRQGKELLGKTLLEICARFPQDPFPYVQLARLYWSQNAHRKAQKTLEEAWQQAPYDLQVREHYSLGLLRAAVMARRRRAYHLARKDLNEALELGVKGLLPLAYAVRAGMDHLQSEDGEAAADALLELPDALLRYRAGICFYLDLRTMGRSAGPLARKVKSKLHAQLRKDLPRLSGAELVAILAPLSDSYAGFFGPFNPVAFFTSLSPRIVAKLDDQDVLIVYAQLLGAGAEKIQIKWVRRDLEERLRKNPGNIFLKFYGAMIHYLLNPFAGVNRFEALLHGLNGSETEALGEFCRKIAPHFDNPLRTALNFLDFNVLVERRQWIEPGFEFEDDAEPVEEDDSEDPLENMVAMFEAMAGEKGATEFLFEMLVRMVDEEEEDDDKVRELGFMLQERAPQLVRKLRRVYSGKNARRLGRTGRLMLFPEKE